MKKNFSLWQYSPHIGELKTIFLSKSRCSERSNEIKICNFSTSWRSERSGDAIVDLNKKNNVLP